MATVESESSHSKKRKRKRNKKRENVNEEAATVEEDKDDDSFSRLAGKKRHLQEIREHLGLDALLREDSHSQEEGQEDSHSPHSRKRAPPEIVVFDDPKLRKKERELKYADQQKQKQPGPVESKSGGKVLDLRQAKFDVQQFSIQCLRSSEKEEAKTQLALSLGAKPAKREYVNYKELLEKQKERKAQEDVLRAMEQAMGYKMSSSQKKLKKKRKKDKNDVGWADGQVGRFRSGVQVVRQRDLVAGRGSKR